MANASATLSAPAPYATHDHAHCVGTALDRARALCAERGVRLTHIRERVLNLVWSGHTPRGAYDILEDLARQEGKRVAPLTVYRALDLLVEQGLVHRIESLNAFVGCSDPGRAHAGQFIVCRQCGTATEMTDGRVSDSVAAAARDRGFLVHSQTVEILGVCPACRAA